MNIRTIVLALGCVALTASCSKYEDNDGITLQSKKARVANTWVIDKAFDNGNDVTSDFDEYTLQLFSDGDARLVALYDYQIFSLETETDGTWDFENSKENLSLDFEDDNADGEYQILRLEEDALWLRQSGDDLELQLRPL